MRTGRIGEEALLDRLGAQGFRSSPLEGQPGFHRLVREPVPLSATLEHWHGLLYVQQASTGVAAPALAPEPSERVLDMCAAPGGKTTHVAELMRDEGCLVASEISESRIRGLLGNVYRLAHTNVAVVAADGRALPEDALFDRVLVDAPCSGEGTLRRRSGSPPEQSDSFLGYVTSVQGALLEKAVRVTRPGGVVLYVTCTFSPDENEAVVSDALDRLPVELEPLDLPVAHAPGVTSFEARRFDPRVEGAARIYPHHLDSGGLFLCRLRRVDGEMDGDDGRASRSAEAERADAEAGRTERADAEAGRAESVDAARRGSAARVARDGWSRVPWRFPDDARPTSADDEAARARILSALDEVRERYGIDRDLGRVGWTDRGGRAWMHTAGEWPLGSWPAGRWRPISIGLRAIEFDSKGRPRPTNDFLRWAAGSAGVLDLDEDRFRTLLRREPVAVAEERRGPVAVGMEGEVLGRGAVTGDGLKSEIPKARAKDLLRVMDAG